MKNFEIGDLVRVTTDYKSVKLGPIQKELIEKKAIGIVSGVKVNYYRAYNGSRHLIEVLWNDGSTSEINEIYLEFVNESDV
jgi:hypothetical protein